MSNFQIKLRSFDSKILYMNGMYKLPIAPYPSIKTVAEHEAKGLPVHAAMMDGREMLVQRLSNFRKVLYEECTEIDDVIKDVEDQDSPNGEIECLVNMADLLGDIVVYCYSEAAKFGIPLSEVLNIIMDSNFSKLGADAQPIYDERGKVQKGPFYWKPEPKIKEFLLSVIAEHQAQKGIVHVEQS